MSARVRVRMCGVCVRVCSRRVCLGVAAGRAVSRRSDRTKGRPASSRSPAMADTHPHLRLPNTPTLPYPTRTYARTHARTHANGRAMSPAIAPHSLFLVGRLVRVDVLRGGLCPAVELALGVLGVALRPPAVKLARRARAGACIGRPSAGGRCERVGGRAGCVRFAARARVRRRTRDLENDTHRHLVDGLPCF